MLDRALFKLSVSLLAVAIAPLPAFAQRLCKPVLAFKEVSHSEPQGFERTWTATLSVDASSCAVEAGRFTIAFVRLAENAPDLDFVERFGWSGSQASAAIVLGPGESVFSYRIFDVEPCSCRR